MNVRLESLPALSLAAGALTAAMALGSRSYFEYAMFAVLVAASIFIVLRGGRRAPGTFLVGLSVAAASFFMTMTPPVPAEYVGGGEALYTLSIDKTFNGQASLRCEATALARDGKECRPFRCSVIVMDVLSGLSEGDVVCLRGEPEPVGMFADVPYMDAEEMFVRAGGISAVFKTSIDGVTVVGRHDDIRLRMTSLRDRAALALYSSELPTDVSSTLATALLGADAPPPGVKERFRSAGLSHLLCISGFHIFIIAGMISFLLYPLRLWSRVGRLRYFLIILLVWLYVAFIGFPLSAVRASVMLSAFYVVRLMQRELSPYNTLALAVALMIFVQPRCIFDPGFQLSVTAVIGILLFADSFNPVPRRHRALRYAVALFLVPLAATIATLPVVLAWFHRVPLLSVPANACASLLFPPFMVLGAGEICLGLPFSGILEWISGAMKKICDIADMSMPLYIDDSVLFLSVAVLASLALAVHFRGRKTALLFMLCVEAMCVTACVRQKTADGLLVCGDSRRTQVCFVSNGRGAVFTSKPIRKILFGAGTFFEGCGIEPDSVLINPRADGSLPFFLAAKGTSADSLSHAEILVVDRSFDGDAELLVEKVAPETIVLGADIKPELRGVLTRNAGGRTVVNISRKAYWRPLPSSSMPLRK